MNCIIVYSTFPSKEEAVKTIRIILEEQLAAGANILQAESMFRWQGKIEQRNEWGVFFQAERRFYKRIERRIKQLHPDTVPQVVMWRMKDGYPQFLKWIMDETVNPVLKRERKEKAARAKQTARDLKKGVNNAGNKN
jgi:periplasmic divalent cation tolerance protein